MACALNACDAPIEEPEDIHTEDAEHRAKVIPPKLAWHGRWEGEIQSPKTGFDYDATIALNAPLCPVMGVHELTAEWDYYTLGIQCTSVLTPVGTSTNLDGTKIYTFTDTTQSGPCINGLVDLAETKSPNVMQYTWRTLQDGIDAQGTVTLEGLCTPPF